MKWALCAVISLVILLAYLNYSTAVKNDLTDRSIVKKSRQNETVVMKPKTRSESEDKGSVATRSTTNRAVASSGGDERLDPLKNPMLAGAHARNQTEKKIYSSIAAEKRESLNLQIVGNGTWSLFSDLQVSKDPVHNTLFEFGPYHVSRKEGHDSGTSMGLIVEENQKQLGVLTGRIVVKVKDLYDIDPVVRDYGLKIDTVSTEIRTAYLDASHLGAFAKLNQTLKNDHRVERFYFEVVRNDWVKN